MKQKLLYVIAVVAVVAGMCALVWHVMQPSAPKHMTLAQAESDARRQPKLPVCLNLVSQNWPGNVEGKAIGKVVGAKLTERPSYIAYGLYFKTFDVRHATGTIIYDGTSGNTFNFAVSRSNGSGNWKLTQFDACE